MHDIFVHEPSLTALLFVFGFLQVLRPVAVQTFVFMGQKVLEPNKYGFLSILIFVPVFICFIGFPLIANLPILVLNYSAVIGFGFIFLAYHTLCEIENKYREDQIRHSLVESLVPLNLPKGVRGVHKVFSNKYNFNEERTQVEFAKVVSQNLSLHEFARLVGDCRAVGNLSPLISNVNPNLDLRMKIDDFYNIRMAEWKGWYPLSLRSGLETVFNRDMIETCN